MKSAFRCDRCGRAKPRFILHKCYPARVQFYQAWRRAWASLTADPKRPGPPRKPPRITAPVRDVLPRPAPTPRSDSTPGAPAPLPAPVGASAGTVILLPTQLLRDTTAQRDGEPVTVKTRVYPSTTISALRKRCQCPPGMCTAAAIATMLHSLPWSYTVSLDAPPGELLSRVNRFLATGLKALDSLVSSPPRLCDPFYILSVAKRYRFGTEGLHAHLAVGNLTYDETLSLLSSWGYVAPNAIVRADRPGKPTWSALHYVLDQAPLTGDPEIDAYPSLRHLCDFGRGMGHYLPPILSPALEDSGSFQRPIPGILSAFRRVLRSTFAPSRFGARRRRQPSRSKQARRAERNRARQRTQTIRQEKSA